MQVPDHRPLTDGLSVSRYMVGLETYEPELFYVSNFSKSKSCSHACITWQEFELVGELDDTARQYAVDNNSSSLLQIVSEHLERKNKAVLTDSGDESNAAQVCACSKVFICWDHVRSGDLHVL